MLCQALCIISKPSVNTNCSNSTETLNSGQNHEFFVPCELEIWRMTLKNNRAPPRYFKFCVSFHSHRSIQTGVTAWKHQIRVKITVSCPVPPCKFGRWPWKIIEHPHLLCDFKLCASFRSHLWIQTGVTVRKRPIWVMIDDFCPVWPWQLTDAIETQRDTYAMLIWTCCIFSKPLMNPNFSYNAETPNLGQNLWIFIPCDLEILTDVLDKQ